MVTVRELIEYLSKLDPDLPAMQVQRPEEFADLPVLQHLGEICADMCVATLGPPSGSWATRQREKQLATYAVRAGITRLVRYLEECGIQVEDRS